MASAADQAQRNEEIVAAHAAGESSQALAARFGLSRSRIRQIVDAGATTVVARSDAMSVALERREEYRRAAAELRELAWRLPDSQAAAKVGAYRALLEALDRLTALDRALGFLPGDLNRLRSERALIEAVFAVFVENDVPVEARKSLVAKLQAAQAA
jgi:hypothetical protein